MLPKKTQKKLPTPPHPTPPHPQSVEQVANRADRMGIEAEELLLFSATDVEEIVRWMGRLQPRLMVVDSIQTIYLAEATGSAGSVSQVRECTSLLKRAAIQAGVAIVVVGHVTKGGEIAGPKMLEHIVDTVLYMEVGTDNLWRTGKNPKK